MGLGKGAELRHHPGKISEDPSPETGLESVLLKGFGGEEGGLRCVSDDPGSCIVKGSEDKAADKVTRALSWTRGGGDTARWRQWRHGRSGA